MIGLIAITGLSLSTIAWRTPRTASRGSIEREWIARAIHDDVGLRERIEHAGRRLGRLRPVELQRLHRVGGAAAHEIILECELAGGRADDGSQTLVGDRRDAALKPDGRTELSGDGGERRALSEAVSAVEVCGEVVIADREPGGAAERLETPEHAAIVAGQAPAGLGIHHPGERVHHGVEVGRDV